MIYHLLFFISVKKETKWHSIDSESIEANFFRVFSFQSDHAQLRAGAGDRCTWLELPDCAHPRVERRRFQMAQRIAAVVIQPKFDVQPDRRDEVRGLRSETAVQSGQSEVRSDTRGASDESSENHPVRQQPVQVSIFRNSNLILHFRSGKHSGHFLFEAPPLGAPDRVSDRVFVREFLSEFFWQRVFARDRLSEIVRQR